MKLTAIDKHDKKRKPSEVIGITRDGWVIGKDGAFGDNGEDCELAVEMKGYLKDFRKENNLSQQEVAWMLGLSRSTYITLEQNKRGLSLKEFLILSHFLPDTKFDSFRNQIPQLSHAKTN